MSFKNAFKNPLAIPVIVLVILVVILASVQTATNNINQPKELYRNHSIYNDNNSGYRAWFLTMEKSGVDVHIWRKPFTKLAELPKSATMLISQPQSAIAGNQISFREEQFKQVLDWASQGNTVILLDDLDRLWLKKALKRENITLLPDPKPGTKNSTKKSNPKTDKNNDDDNTDDKIRHTLTVNPSQKRLQSFLTLPVLVESDVRLSPDSLQGRQDQWLLQDKDGHPVLISIPYLNGKLIVGTTPAMISNEQINDPEHDNYQFLTNLLLSENHPIYINEFVHGKGSENSILAYLNQNTPLGKVFTQLAFIFLLILWLSFTPWYPKQHIKDQEESMALKVFIQSLGGILFRYNAGCLGLKAYLKKLEDDTQRIYQTPLSDTVKLKQIIQSRLSGSSTYTGNQKTPAEKSNTRYNKEQENTQQRSIHTADDLISALEESQRIVQQEQKVSHKKLLTLTQQLHQLEDIISHDRQPHQQ